MKTNRRFLSILLSLALILGLMPGTSLTAFADDDPPYAQYKNTTTEITFDSKSWYLIDYDANTVTLLAKECVASSMYNASVSFVEYSNNPTVKTVVDNYYNKRISADAQTAVSGNAMFLLTTAQAIDITNADVRKDATAANGDWWLCSQGDTAGTYAAFVDGGSGDVNAYGNDVGKTLGVRPALKLNLSSVIFSSESKTFVLKQTIAAENVTVTYGDTDKKVSANVTKPATSGGAISYTVKTGSEDFIAVDSTTGALTIKKVPSDGRAYVIVTAAESGKYGKTTKEVTVTLNKANAAPATVTANNCTYDGAEKPLVTVTGTATGGTMQYALGTKDAATQTYTTSIPTAVGAGTYYVWYKVIGDENHMDTEPVCLTVTIAEKEEQPQPGTDGQGGGLAGTTPDHPESLDAVEQRIMNAPNDNDISGSTFSLLQLRGDAGSKTAIRLKWKTVSGASSYTVYGNRSGRGRRYEKIATVSGPGFAAKKLKKGTYYKFIVAAQSGDQVLAISKTVLVTTKGGKYTNDTKVTVKKSSLKLKTGKKEKIKYSLKNSGKAKRHRNLCFESSNTNVAKVSKKGVVRAVGRGSCYVYAYAQNGVCRRIKVVVK